MGLYSQALPLLGEAFYVEVTKDGLSWPEMTKLADQILVSLHERSGDELEEGDLEPIRRSFVTLIDDPRWHCLEDTLDLAVLAHKVALICIASRWSDVASRRAATKFNLRAIEILRRDAEN